MGAGRSSSWTTVRGSSRGGESGPPDRLSGQGERHGGERRQLDDPGGDVATESAVLRQLLDLHPIQLTVAELVREIGGEQADFAERDAIERAVRDLAGAGLLHHNDELRDADPGGAALQRAAGSLTTRRRNRARSLDSSSAAAAAAAGS